MPCDKSLTCSLLRHRSPLGYVMYSCCVGMDTEWGDEDMGQLRFFKEPTKKTHARLLLTSGVSCNKSALLEAHWWATPHPRKFKGDPLVGHNAQGLGL